MDSRDLGHIWPGPGTTVEDTLSRFAGLANKGSPHPRDWGRFYQFIVMAHASHVGWDDTDVLDRLLKFGFSREKAEYFSEAYWHGRCALYVHAHFGCSTSYSKWMRQEGVRLT